MVEHLLEGRPLDYLLINHMEPDHGASVEEILIRYPKCKVISTEKSFMIMRQFGFHIDSHELIQVKEGDTYNFGKTHCYLRGSTHGALARSNGNSRCYKRRAVFS